MRRALPRTAPALEYPCMHLPAPSSPVHIQAAAPGGVVDVISLTLQPDGGIPMRAVPRVPAV